VLRLRSGDFMESIDRRRHAKDVAAGLGINHVSVEVMFSLDVMSFK
jgi:hypothetical protein